MAMEKVTNKMDEYLKDFEVPAKNSSEEALKRWRKAAWLVRNRCRRFRMVADLNKRSELALKKRTIQEEVRVALYVHKAALRFSDAGRTEFKLSKETQEAGFGIDPDEVASLVRGTKGLNVHGGIEDIAKKVSISLDQGVQSKDIPLRQKIYGCNKYAEKPPKGFWMFVWEALQDLTLIMLMVCAVVSIGVGVPTEGWPKGMYDGVGILVSIILVVLVTGLKPFSGLMATEMQKTNPTHAENPKKTLNDAPPIIASSIAQSQFDSSAERLPSDSKQPTIPDRAGAATTKDPDDSKSKGMNGAGAAISALPANVQKKVKRAERFGVPVLLSEEEKRNSRAERFGTGSGIDTKGSEEQKRKARAERFGLAAQSTADEDAKKKARLERFSPVTKVDPQEEEKRKARALRFSQPRTVSTANKKGRVESNIAATGKAGGEA